MLLPDHIVHKLGGINLRDYRFSRLNFRAVFKPYPFGLTVFNDHVLDRVLGENLAAIFDNNPLGRMGQLVGAPNHITPVRRCKYRVHKGMKPASPLGGVDSIGLIRPLKAESYLKPYN